MSARCPLCLELLGPAERLRRFCPAHPREAEPFAPATVESVRCPVSGCRTDALGDGHALLLAHVGCRTGQNPFFQPGADGGGTVEVTNSTSDGKIVTHWQIDALRAAAAAYPRAREMWFPSVMLVDGPRGRELHGGARAKVLVSLTGTIAVGKTFFAMHALDPDGYQDLDRCPSSDYIYCYPNVATVAAVPQPAEVPASSESSLLRHDVRRGTGPASATAGGSRLDTGAQEFLDTLHLRVLMKRNEAFGKLRGTQIRPRNIKVAFFGSPPPPAPPAVSPGDPGKGLKGFLKHAKNELGEAAREIQTQLAHGSSSQAERVLLLYDIAGEEATKGYSPVIADHDLRMDVLAVVLSAEDLPGGGKSDRETVRTANARLQSIRALRDQAKSRASFRCCLVVTKLDLLAGAPTSFPPGSGSWTKFLLDLLSKAPADVNYRALRGYIEGRRKLVDGVFFAWPEGGIDQDAPQVQGLEDFVDWCFRG